MCSLNIYEELHHLHKKRVDNVFINDISLGILLEMDQSVYILDDNSVLMHMMAAVYIVHIQALEI